MNPLLKAKVSTSFRNLQAGGALLYVVTMATVLAGLFAISIYLSRTGSNFIAKETWKGQASLISQSGVAFLQDRLTGELRDTAKSKWIFEPINLHYALDSIGTGFDVSARRLGLVLQVQSEGKVGNRNLTPASRTNTLLASGISLSELPAIALTDKNAGIILGGISGIGGAAMIWREGIGKSTESQIRWKGGSGHEGPLWDSASNRWKNLEIGIGAVDDWFKLQNDLVSGPGMSSGASGEIGTIDLERLDSVHLQDTSVASLRLVSKGTIHLDRGARLENCEVAGSLVIIERGALLKNTVVFSSGKILAFGAILRGGQYFAVDTIRISDGTELLGCPIFLVKGRKKVFNKRDTIPSGGLNIAEAKGMGVFISVPEKGRMIANSPSLTIEKDARVSGLFYTGGLADIKSGIKGSVFCHNLISIDGGSFRIGCLKDARIDPDFSNAYLPGPLMFPAFPIISFPLLANSPHAE